jgi:NAD(P)-dependent dehydrogenase (short-subunit alcohol dehydrogenase family)
MVRRGAQAGGRLVGTDRPALTQGPATCRQQGLWIPRRTGCAGDRTRRGIGQAIAAGLAERGTRIVLGDIDYVSEASDLIGATGHPAVPVTPDVSDRPSTEAARDRVTDALGRVDIGAIKRRYDPQNLFHHNANIQPA